MQLECLFVSARSATLALRDGGLYNTLKPYRLSVEGAYETKADRVITSLYGLLPDTSYRLCVWDGEEKLAELSFDTASESCTLDVRRFGAVGDGTHDDTAAIQAAIVCCPPEGRVLIPRGLYLVGPLFLKSHIRLEVARDAELRLITDRSRFPVLPGLTETTDEQSEFTLGSWEGNPLDMFAALLTGMDLEDVQIYGEGLLDGQAQLGDWWQSPKVKRGAWRGRLLYLCRCSNVTVQGIRFQNSPAWNLHPHFSSNLQFFSIGVTAPADSPNTDGFDPESCRGVLLAGAHFSLGDDCIALKSGKLYMGRTYRTPCEDVEIMHCLMENGHGGVTIGSEMAGGVKNVRVHDCLMRHTDRGLRIKTRRGRGKDGIIDDITFTNVRMEHVGAPLVVNAMYFCDPDGKTPYVQSREPQPVDERTPYIGKLTFTGIHADGCHACAGYFLGLPEQPIERITITDTHFTYAPDATPMPPAMAVGVDSCLRRGLITQNVRLLECRNVSIEGQDGERLSAENVEKIEWEDESK